jgi:hypothetical protein
VGVYWIIYELILFLFYFFFSVWLEEI